MGKNHGSRPVIYVIVTCRNAGQHISEMLKSLLDQTFENYECIIYNDASTDNTSAVIHQLVGSDNRFRVINGVTRVWATAGRWTCLNQIRNAPGNSIAVLLDGDDWLYDNNVLSYLVSQYLNSPYLSGHGNYVSTNGKICDWSEDYPEEIKQQARYREYPWVATHLRWFRLGLRRYIPYSALLDAQGIPFKTATDFALFLPILELSGRRTAFCPKPLYVYNQRNGQADNAAGRQLQIEAELEIRNKRPLKPINAESVLQ